MKLVVDRDRRRAIDHEDEDVALVVDLLARPRAGSPGEQRRVEIVRRLTPDRTAGDRTRAALELISRQPLDQRKQLTLLEPHVRLEQLADLTHRGTDVGCTLKLCDERM